MTNLALSKMRRTFLTIALVLAAGIIAFYVLRPTREKAGPTPDEDKVAADHTPGFRECAAQVGIDFRMAFLPGEQGEKFKINLYDHGCGVAVGDFDGDGFDDIYFLNQLGRN